MRRANNGTGCRAMLIESHQEDMMSGRLTSRQWVGSVVECLRDRHQRKRSISAGWTDAGRKPQANRDWCMGVHGGLADSWTFTLDNNARQHEVPSNPSLVGYRQAYFSIGPLSHPTLVLLAEWVGGCVDDGIIVDNRRGFVLTTSVLTVYWRPDRNRKPTTGMLPFEMEQSENKLWANETSDGLRGEVQLCASITSG
ncbi:uncharacterized protein LY79DRAFT_581525 [Colletotrichum navitas]|uniref:Uncharacterized protein n=1 Tax=Colletotrichum navitas TaxID=681940 RepID=A0AAD8PVC7_9PEZI|nr:uncharacterized protein LY79DRAFT_581525 [Colletotrichum navitas]KAK1584745.1 hypothetical protein LY79DRAFT_581525 [Colletotrichum navitas]